MKELTTIIYVICTALGMYQSVKSVILFCSYPTSTTFGEAPITYDDFPYLVMCKRNDYWDTEGLTNLTNGETFLDIFGGLLHADIDDMEDFPWASVSLEEYYEAFKIPKTIVAMDKPKKIYENYRMSFYEKEPQLIYTVWHGMCQYLKPWFYENDMPPNRIEIPANLIEGAAISFQPQVNKLKTCFVGLTDYKKTFLESSSTHKRSFSVDIVKRKRLSVNGYTCIDSSDYNQMKCQETCLLKAWYSHEEATCELPWIKSNLNLPTCNSYEDYKQLMEIVQNRTFYITTITDCEKQCHDPCTALKFKVNEIFPEALGTSHLHFKFDSIIQTIEESRVYRFLNMFGDIGGILGIFLGISVIGLYEDSIPYLLKLKNIRHCCTDKPSTLMTKSDE